MTTANDRTQMRSDRSAVRAIVTGLLIAGVLDASFAVIVDVVILHAFSLLGVLQWIASGPLGRAAFAGGLATAALGVAIHFALAAHYVRSGNLVADGRDPAAQRRAHGAVRPDRFRCISSRPHGFFVGLPIALAVKRYAL